MTDIFEHVPYSDQIIDDGEITVSSIFQFKNGNKELFPFLHGCKKRRCAVLFENEGIRIDKNGTSTEQDVLLSVYALLAQDDKVVKDYIKFISKVLLNEIDMDRPNITVKGQHEPILKD